MDGGLQFNTVQYFCTRRHFRERGPGQNGQPWLRWMNESARAVHAKQSRQHMRTRAFGGAAARILRSGDWRVLRGYAKVYGAAQLNNRAHSAFQSGSRRYVTNPRAWDSRQMAPSWFALRKPPQSPPVAAKPPALELLDDEPTPVMEEPMQLGVVAADDGAAAALGMRPSILEFRSSRFVRVNHQRQQMLQAMADAANAAVARPHFDKDKHEHYDDARSTTSSTRTTEKTTQDEDNDDDCGVLTTDDDEDDDDAFDADDAFRADAERVSRRHRRQQQRRSMNASAAAITLPSPSVGLQNHSSAGTDSEDEYDDDDDLLLLMPMPASQEVPLLEVVAENDENDVDLILCPDPRRLPRTMVVDEDGFQISRESLMVSAARVDRAATIKAGLLFKQGFGLLNGGWKVRYVTITSTKMTFFREERGRKRGEIDLAQCSTKSIEIMPRDSVYDGAHATVWRFAIRGKGGRRVLLSAYSETEMKDWLRCLHVALAVQGAGVGRFTDFVVPSGTFLADKNGGLLRSSANYR